MYDFIVTDISYVLERQPNPEWRIGEINNHTHHILAIAVSGKAHYDIEGTQYTVSKGDLLYYQKNVTHSGYSDAEDPWSFYTVAFDLESPSGEAGFPAHYCGIIHTPFYHKIIELFSDLSQAWTGKKPGHLLRCRSLVMDILYQMVRTRTFSLPNSPHTPAIENVINLMQVNYNLSYSVQELATLAGLSPSHFRLIFKKVTGVSLLDYQNRIKLGKAKDLLLSGDCNVTEAASQTGFGNVYYFSRLFKQVMNVSPSYYLRK
ncbi:MAG: helix-turn-helix transcriptional regulator [Gorillibacterium sp.]|nr:helix-turn-helix transcriptional regulator [Gorillibacterium sp.]